MKAAEDYTYFLRKYGPIVQNQNMFGEEIQHNAQEVWTADLPQKMHTSNSKTIPAIRNWIKH